MVADQLVYYLVMRSGTLWLVSKTLAAAARPWAAAIITDSWVAAQGSSDKAITATCVASGLADSKLHSYDPSGAGTQLPMVQSPSGSSAPASDIA